MANPALNNKMPFPAVFSRRPCCPPGWHGNSEPRYGGTLTMRLSFAASIGAAVRGDVLLRSAAFRRFWLSSTLNGFGGQISNMAIPLCSTLLLGAGPAEMGMLLALELLPFFLFCLPAGVWLDRNRKLPILLLSKTISALALFSIALAHWCGVLSMPWLYCVGFVSGVCQVFGGGAEQIFLTTIVGRDGLVTAQTRFTVTDSAARLVGPGIAGMMIQVLTAPFALLVTASTLVVSIFTMRGIDVREPLPTSSGIHPLREIQEGLLFIWRHPILRSVAVSLGALNLLLFGHTALGILFATRILGLSAGQLGMAQAFGGLGMLTSALLVKPLMARYGTGPTMLIGITATSACYVLTAALPASLADSDMMAIAAYGILLLLRDCGVMLLFIPYMSLRQKVTPDHFLGRIISTTRFLTVASAPAGAFLAGVIAEHHGIRTAQVCIAAASVMLTVALIFTSPLARHR